MADAAPWIAFAAALAFFALPVCVLLRLANRSPTPRRRTVVALCAPVDLAPPANGNTPPRSEVYDDSAHVGG